jgi:hypothetical protein
MSGGDLMSLAEEYGAEVTDYVNYAYESDMAVFGEDALAAFAERIRSEERERCAKLVESFPYFVDEDGEWGNRGGLWPQEHATLAAAIRKGG